MTQPINSYIPSENTCMEVLHGAKNVFKASFEGIKAIYKVAMSILCNQLAKLPEWDEPRWSRNAHDYDAEAEESWKNAERYLSFVGHHYDKELAWYKELEDLAHSAQASVVKNVKKLGNAIEEKSKKGFNLVASLTHNIRRLLPI